MKSKFTIQNKSGQFLTGALRWSNEFPHAEQLKSRSAAASLALLLPTTAGLRIVKDYGLESATVVWDADAPTGKTCECSDPGCPVHPGKSSCGNRAKTILVRVDMDDRTGTAFCEACASDALDSGLFNESVKLKIKAGL